jgi:hypothetical protein
MEELRFDLPMAIARAWRADYPNKFRPLFRTCPRLGRQSQADFRPRLQHGLAAAVARARGNFALFNQR